MSQDNPSDDSQSTRLNRRKMLALTAGVTTGLAGCSGNNDESNTSTATDTELSLGTRSPTPTDSTGEGDETPTDTATEAGDPVEPVIDQRVAASWNPNDTNVAPLANNNGPWWQDYVWRVPTSYPNNRGQAQFMLVDSVEVSDCEVTLNLKENYKWWNGDPVTAQDWLSAMRIGEYTQGTTPEKTDVTNELVDDYTIKQTLPSPQNPALVRYNTFGTVNAPHSWWKPYLDRYRDASSQKQRDEVTKDLTETKMSLQELVDDGLGAGMWKPVEYDTTKIVHEKFEDHPRADWTNLEKYTWRLQADDQKARQGIKGGDYDVGHTLLTEISGTDKVEIFQNFPVTGVQKVAFNFNNQHLARRKVRRAIAHLIDLNEVKQVLKSKNGKRTSVPNTLNGMSGAVSGRWLGDSFNNELIDYGKNSQPEKAKSLLRDAGYSKQSGRWVGPDGNKVEWSYITPPWGTYKTTAKYISSALNQFGLKTNLTIPSSSGFNKRWRDTYEFDMANWFYKGWHPSQIYDVASGAGLDDYRALVPDDWQASGSGCEVRAESPELTADRSERLNHPVRPEFPKQVGQEGTSGEMQTLKPIKWLDLLNQISSKQRTKDITEKIAWFYNWQVPHMGVYESTWSFWGDTKNFNMLGDHKHPHAQDTNGEHTINIEPFWTMGHIGSKTE